MYLQQAQQHLMTNPSPQAHAQVQFWTSVVQAGLAAQQQHQMPGAQHGGTNVPNMHLHAAQAAAAAPAYTGSAAAGAPSPLFGGQSGPTFHQGRCAILSLTMRLPLTLFSR